MIVPLKNFFQLSLILESIKKERQKNERTTKISTKGKSTS